MKITDGMIERGAGASLFPGEELRVLAERRRLAKGVLHAALDYVREPKAPEAPASGKLPRYRQVKRRELAEPEGFNTTLIVVGLLMLPIGAITGSIATVLAGAMLVWRCDGVARAINADIGRMFRYELDE